VWDYLDCAYLRQLWRQGQPLDTVAATCCHRLVKHLMLLVAGNTVYRIVSVVLLVQLEYRGIPEGVLRIVEMFLMTYS
jgi:hypothetical protein